jgi:hypothetical protein
VAAHALLLDVESNLTMAIFWPMPPRFAGNGGYAFAMVCVPGTRLQAAVMTARLWNKNPG